MFWKMVGKIVYVLDFVGIISLDRYNFYKF